MSVIRKPSTQPITYGHNTGHANPPSTVPEPHVAADAAAGTTIHCCIGGYSDDARENSDDDLDDDLDLELSCFISQLVEDAEPEQEPEFNVEQSLPHPFLAALEAGSDDE